MKVAILSESPDDAAAIRIFVAAILERETQEISLDAFQVRSYSVVINVLPAVLSHLHYRTDAEALVVVIDSDDSPVHQSSHDEAGGAVPSCRLCNLRSLVASRKANLRAVPGRGEIKTALGLAVPAIEAWYRCVRDPHVNEATWARKLASERITYTRNSLKRDVYGTERPSVEMKKAKAVEAAEKLADDIALVETLFPSGFGSFANDVRSWQGRRP
jgi:hypothetical protein